MVGFTESFNISVSAALCLYSITTRLRNSDVKWQLTADERDDILLDWLKTSIKDSENIVKLYHQRTNQV
jgi:tRNA (guanosine-2'-O-)-methyltransferase